MTANASSTPVTFALLIGIDFYLPGRLAGGGSYPSLRGCVRDILHVERFLHDTLTLPQDRIFKLTSTNTGVRAQQTPPEPPEQVPTYERMVGLFAQVTDTAQPGDQVYVHYSGHGGRTPTLVPDQKGPAGLDESLVPVDIHHPSARYLRDVELAVIFKRMVDKGIRLTVVLDSCHSGGAVRGVGDVAIRGTDRVDATVRAPDSLVASQQELAGTWRGQRASGTRNVSAGSGWLPEPEGYVLLAAARPSESAFEFAFDGKERNGALTYWLLDTLRTYGTGLGWQSLHDRIVARVHTQFVQQTPQLQGAGGDAFLGSARIAIQPSVPVLEVDPTAPRVRLAVGQALGAGRQAQFAVYPFGTVDFTDRARRQAVVTIDTPGAVDSWGTIAERLGDAAIEIGAPAVLINPGSARLVRAVGIAEVAELEAGTDEQRASLALDQVRERVARSVWVGLAGDGDVVELQVAVNRLGEYEIWDGTGQALPNLRPALRVDLPDAAERLVGRLEHLARYRATEQLENYDPLSPLAGALSVELVGVQDGYVPGERPRPVPFGVAGGTPELKIGQTAFLKIGNRSAQSLNVAVLDLQPDWGIAQIYPGGPGASGIEIDPGRELPLIPLSAALPAGYQAGRDLLKVIASIGPTNVRLVELPALDQPATRSAMRRRSATAGGLSQLEALFDMIGTNAPRTRNLTSPANPSVEWTTAAVELWVRA